MKPIEAGCLALIIKSDAGNHGVITVGKCLGVLSGRGCSRTHPLRILRWEVNRVMKTTHGNDIYHLGEDQLLRLDDPDIQEEIESELVMVE
ncbi:MAG: hypothetical protein O7D95_02265 [Betaproteobacteria bacterium]|nr:hypothetical protein [Betaproteobacteria bacterium]